jgi:hypothetical protein
MKQVKHLFYSFQFIWTQTESKQVKSQIRAFISQADKEQTQETHFFWLLGRDFELNLFGVNLFVPLPNLFSVPPQSHDKHI